MSMIYKLTIGDKKSFYESEESFQRFGMKKVEQMKRLGLTYFSLEKSETNFETVEL